MDFPVTDLNREWELPAAHVTDHRAFCTRYGRDGATRHSMHLLCSVFELKTEQNDEQMMTGDVPNIATGYAGRGLRAETMMIKRCARRR